MPNKDQYPENSETEDGRSICLIGLTGVLSHHLPITETHCPAVDVVRLHHFVALDLDGDVHQVVELLVQRVRPQILLTHFRPSQAFEGDLWGPVWRLPGLVGDTRHQDLGGAEVKPGQTELFGDLHITYYIFGTKIGGKT